MARERIRRDRADSTEAPSETATEAPIEEQTPTTEKVTEEKGEASGVETIEISELREGEDTFISHGFSNVKVTQKGKVKNLKLKIKSSGITELISDFKSKEPKPPVMDVLVQPNSEMGKEMKLSEKKWVKMPNLTDEKYMEAFSKYESELGIAILQKGLDITLLDRVGKEVTNADRKLEVLKSMGMSAPQFSQAVQDIRNLTEWTEEEHVNYFGGN